MTEARARYALAVAAGVVILTLLLAAVTHLIGQPPP